MNRRAVISNSLAVASGIILSEQKSLVDSFFLPKETSLKGKVNHSACRWCYQSIPLEALIDHCKDLGIKSIELLEPNEYNLVIKSGLDCAIANGSPLHIPKGFNDPQYHDILIKQYEELIPKAAESGIGQIICFSGNKGNFTDAEGIENCANGISKLLKTAEKYDVKLVMELLNSKVDHKDYQCDNSDWGVQLVEKLGSTHFKLLYDIYHMQIMEGDVIATIRKNKDYIAHFHTGGVPGRREINETQELNYRAIIQAIVDTGFTGFVAQEFIPSRPDAIYSLREGITICDI